jgi:hypothetical protein
MLVIQLVGGGSVAFPLSRIGSFSTSRVRSAGSSVYDVRVEDRGASIAWPDVEIDFSVAEMVPEYLGIRTAVAAARRAGSVASKAKATAARANGSRGGRPRKKPLAA